MENECTGIVKVGYLKPEKGVTQHIPRKENEAPVLVIGNAEPKAHKRPRHILTPEGRETLIKSMANIPQILEKGTFISKEDDPYIQAVENAYLSQPVVVVRMIGEGKNPFTIQQEFEKGQDFLADAMELPGFKELLEKHRVKITPM